MDQAPLDEEALEPRSVFQITQLYHYNIEVTGFQYIMRTDPEVYCITVIWLRILY